jgi:hypothetical protein
MDLALYRKAGGNVSGEDDMPVRGLSQNVATPSRNDYEYNSQALQQ